MRHPNFITRIAIFGLSSCLVMMSGCAGAPTRGGDANVARGRGVPLPERGPSGATTEATNPAEPTPTTAGAASPSTSSTKRPRGPHAGPWKVNLSAAAKVGDRFSIKVSAEFRQSLARRIDGVEQKTGVRRALKVESVGKVLEVDARGQVLRSEHTITSCVGTTKDGAHDVLSAGTVLTVRRAGPKPRMTSSAGPISRQDRALLKLVFSTSDLQTTDQEMFGTRAAVHVGEQWTIDTDKTATLLARAGATLDPADLSGSTTLEAATPCGTTTCLRLLTQFEATGFRLKRFPAGVTVVDSGISGHSRRTLPMNRDKMKTTNNDRFSMHITVSAQRGDKEVEVEARVNSREVRVWTPLP